MNAISTVLTAASWLSLSFSKIPPNQVTFTDNKMTIKVQKSAGPVVHKLEKPVQVTQFKVTGVLKGTKAVEKTEFDEDSILRVGLVGVGDKTLNGLQRMFAADWIKRLYSLAPPKTGLDKIYFFNMTNRADLVGKTRIHPKSELLIEKIVQQQSTEGSFTMNVQLEKPIETAALWLSTDGDDTKSEFELTIQKIEISQ